VHLWIYLGLDLQVFAILNGWPGSGLDLDPCGSRLADPSSTDPNACIMTPVKYAQARVYIPFRPFIAS